MKFHWKTKDSMEEVRFWVMHLKMQVIFVVQDPGTCCIFRSSFISTNQGRRKWHAMVCVWYFGRES